MRIGDFVRVLDDFCGGMTVEGSVGQIVNDFFSLSGKRMLEVRFLDTWRYFVPESLKVISPLMTSTKGRRQEYAKTKAGDIHN